MAGIASQHKVRGGFGYVGVPGPATYFRAALVIPVLKPFLPKQGASSPEPLLHRQLWWLGSRSTAVQERGLRGLSPAERGWLFGHSSCLGNGWLSRSALRILLLLGNGVVE